MKMFQTATACSKAAGEERIIPVDLEIVCLWSAFGLTLTGLFFALGFGVDIQQALMLAG
jgi:hypothetical protein